MTEYIILEVIMAYHYFLQIEWCMLRMREREKMRERLPDLTSERGLHLPFLKAQNHYVRHKECKERLLHLGSCPPWIPSIFDMFSLF